MNVEQSISGSVVHKNSSNKLLEMQAQIIQISNSSFPVHNAIYPVLTLWYRYNGAFLGQDGDLCHS